MPDISCAAAWGNDNDSAATSSMKNKFVFTSTLVRARGVSHDHVSHDHVSHDRVS
jgi:hypothetical protein